MKVLIVAEENTRNEYIDLLAKSLRLHGVEVCCTIDDFYSPNSTFDIIHIHWIEAFTKWRIPTKRNLEEIEELLNIWQTTSKIVYTHHNEQPHFLKGNHYALEIQRLVNQKSDGIIHLGRFGLDTFSNRFKTEIQKVIPHGRYEVEAKDSKFSAATELGISLNGKKVLVFGAIRSLEERLLILRVYRKVNRKFKGVYFIIPGWNRIAHPSWTKHPLKRIYSLAITVFAQRKKSLKIAYSEELLNKTQTFFNVADVSFLPRINILNSGVLFLSLSYGLPIVGPCVGNLTEFILASGNIGYEPNNVNEAVQAIESILISDTAVNQTKGRLDYVNKNLGWKEIGERHLDFYKNVMDAQCI